MKVILLPEMSDELSATVDNDSALQAHAFVRLGDEALSAMTYTDVGRLDQQGGLTALSSPIVIEKVLGVGLTKRHEFTNTSDLADYVAAMGPLESEDIAGGFLDPSDQQIMRIPLIGAGGFALIDADDYPLVKAYRWSNWGRSYAYTRRVYGGISSCINMHRVVLMLSENSETVVDHINHNGLDNRKSNLRPCTQAENNRNRQIHRQSKTGVKGVWRSRGRFVAMVQYQGEAHKSTFTSVEEAAEWVRAKRAQLHGEFTCHG